MTPRRFEWLLRVRGPALAVWPDGDRCAAFSLLRRSAQARAALADALAASDDPPAEDLATLSRMQRGLGAAIAARQAPARLAASARWAALAACALLGAWLGTAEAAADQGAASGRDPWQVIASLSPGESLGAMQP